MQGHTFTVEEANENSFEGMDIVLGAAENNKELPASAYPQRRLRLKLPHCIVSYVCFHMYCQEIFPLDLKLSGFPYRFLKYHHSKKAYDDYILSCHGNQKQILLDRYSEFYLFVENRVLSNDKFY